IMIHRAICGSMERFLGILLEHYAGHLPLWLSPIQAVVASVTSEAAAYAESVTQLLKHNNIKTIADTRNEKISYKIREHSAHKIPILVICGEREAATQTVNIRRLGSHEQIDYKLDEFVVNLKSEIIPPDMR